MPKNQQITCSFCIEQELMDEVERVREEHQKEAGFLSRSAVLRLLIIRGLASVRGAGPLQQEALGGNMSEEQIIQDGVDVLLTQCPLCGSVAAVEKQVINTFTVAQNTPDGLVTYQIKDAEGYLCKNCNETFFNKHQRQLLDLKLKIEKLRHALMKVKQGAITWDRDEGWVKLKAAAFDAACEALEELERGRT